MSDGLSNPAVSLRYDEYFSLALGDTYDLYITYSEGIKVMAQLYEAQVVYFKETGRAREQQQFNISVYGKSILGLEKGMKWRDSLIQITKLH